MTVKSLTSPMELIPENRKSVYEYYRLRFDEAGCPMKETEAGLTFHPLLPAYLAYELVREFEKNQNDACLDHAEKILRMALARAEVRTFSGMQARVFMYTPESGLSAHPRPFYSALAQAWYIKAICSLCQHREHFRDELQEIFCSLLIPLEEGGVLLRKEFGWVLEEYPSFPHLYTLNGWLTVLCILIDCQNSLDHFSIPFRELLEKNLNAAAHLIPLYDAGFCQNSRYQLAGFSRVRLVFDRPALHQLISFHMEIPGEGRFPGNLIRKTRYRWENFLERDESKFLQCNVVQSLFPYPTPNVFACRLRVDGDSRLKVFVAQGSYKPELTAMPTERWRQIAEMEIAKGEHDLRIPLEYDDESLFAYPTNFRKKIDNRQFNAYHFVHIDDLAEIYMFSGREIFRDYALKWLDYSEQWSDNPMLVEGGYSLLPLKYGENFRKIVEKKLLGKYRR